MTTGTGSAVWPEVVVALLAWCATTEQVELATWSALLAGEDDPGLDWNWQGQRSLPRVTTVAADLIVDVEEVYIL